jgi:ketosteroid isomerase-like protein
MIYRYAVFIFAMTALLCTPPITQGADVDDLKAVFEQGTKALSALDADGFMASAHEQSITFGAASPVPVDGKAAQQQVTQSVMSSRESQNFTPINPQFRVIGTTGMAWGHGRVAIKPKGGPLETNWVRYTIIYAKSDGKWLRVASHLSRLPSGN